MLVYLVIGSFRATNVHALRLTFTRNQKSKTKLSWTLPGIVLTCYLFHMPCSQGSYMPCVHTCHTCHSVQACLLKLYIFVRTIAGHDGRPDEPVLDKGNCAFIGVKYITEVLKLHEAAEFVGCHQMKQNAQAAQRARVQRLAEADQKSKEVKQRLCASAVA